ncbi:MAG: hypothetical protein JWP34_2240 [Massilia sp.]|nr:hypothetical protein [Massilia sp.]
MAKPTRDSNANEPACMAQNGQCSRWRDFFETGSEVPPWSSLIFTNLVPATLQISVQDWPRDADTAWEIDGASAANRIAKQAIQAAKRRVIFFIPMVKLYISARLFRYQLSTLDHFGDLHDAQDSEKRRALPVAARSHPSKCRAALTLSVQVVGHCVDDRTRLRCCRYRNSPSLRRGRLASTDTMSNRATPYLRRVYRRHAWSAPKTSRSVPSKISRISYAFGCHRALPGWHDAVVFPVNLSEPGTKNATNQRRKRLRLETDKLQCLTSPRCVPYIKDMSSSLHLFTSLPLAGALSLATLLAARA